MSAPMVAGAAAIGFQLDPSLTPNKAKALLLRSGRPLSEGIKEVSLSSAARIVGLVDSTTVNRGLTPSTYIDPATGEIDYARSSWSRSSWSCVSCGVDDASQVDPKRSSWS